jgi:hypothetical protein
MRLAETKKESYEFDRDIVKGSVNQRTSKVIAEKVLRYFDDRLRARVHNILFFFFLLFFYFIYLFFF